MMLAVLLVVLMVVTVAAMELCLHCSAKSKESVESRTEIAGD